MALAGVDPRPLVAHDVWTWGRWVTRPCPGCGCTPDAPCTITLYDGESTGQCVPAGAYNREHCSRCEGTAP